MVKHIKIFLALVAIATIAVFGFIEANNIGGNKTKLEGSKAEYQTVKVEMLSEMTGFKPSKEFQTSDVRAVDFVGSKVKNSMIPAEGFEMDTNIYEYRIELSGEQGSYSVKLYYDTLYDKAHIEKDGGLYETEIDFARYIDSLLENPGADFDIGDDKALELFGKYGWTIDYQISSQKINLGEIEKLSSFDPSSYYFAYNNELSKDIGLDMSGYKGPVDVHIYRVYESMPKEFYPMKDGRGIVVKSDGKIIGAFISAGRHSAFSACSLIGNGFEKSSGMTVDDWILKIVETDSAEKSLSKLEPEDVISEYFS